MKTHNVFYAPEGDSTSGGGSSAGAAPSTSSSAPSTASPTSPSGGGGITGPKAVFGDLSPSKEPAIVAKPAAPAKPTTSVVEPATPTPPAAPNSLSLTDQQLATLADKLTAGRAAPVAAPSIDDNRPLTPQEQSDFDKQFHVMRVTPEMFTKIMGFAPENADQLKQLEAFGHGLVRQASAMTMYQVQRLAEDRQRALEGRLSPILSQHQAAVAAKTEESFFAHAPDLKGFDSLIVEITAAEKARGTKFKTEAEAIQFVANKARSLLKLGAPGTSQPANGGQPQRKVSMPPVSMGGRLGGSTGSPQPTSGPKAVFGDLDGAR